VPRSANSAITARRVRSGFSAIRANSHSINCDFTGQGANGSGRNLVAEIEAMEGKIGKRMYRGLLKRVARVWAPQQIREIALQQQVLAQMQGAERGLARLQVSQARRAPEIVQRIIVSLNARPAKLDDLQTLHSLVVALGKEVEAGQTRG